MKKKNNNNKYKKGYNSNNSYSSEVATVIKIVALIAVLFGLMYIFTLFIINKGDKDSIKANKPESQIQYEKVLATNTFKQDESEYMVLFYDMTDITASTYTKIIGDYQQLNEDKIIYTVDLSDTFNKTFVTDIGNKDVSNIDELRVGGPTLIKIVDGEVDSYIEGKEEIAKFLS